MKDAFIQRGNAAFVRTSRLLVWGCGAALLVMSVVITVEALMRKFLNHSFGGVDEITSYVFAITTTLALPLAILQRANIRIDIVRNIFPRRMRVALDVLAWAVFTGVFAIIAWRACDLAWESWLTGARSITPMRSYLAIHQGLWALGLVASVIASLWVAIWAVALAVSGRAETAAALLSPADEVALELSTISPSTVPPSKAPATGDRIVGETP